MDKTTRVIAFYLPQFHPIPENDEWWGKGFTEWTNVSRAKPLFKGHYQPRFPADLGYYDLRVPEVREEQAKLARYAGVHGFCYWHYWFGNKKTLIERPFQEVLKSGKPDFPFCLGWANESWEAKIWNTKDSDKKNRMLIEQQYLGKEDNEKHFNYLLDAFKDKRYIRFDNKPVFLIYRPLKFKNLSAFIEQWNDLVKENNIAESFYFVANVYSEDEFPEFKKQGVNAITISPSARMDLAFKKMRLVNKIYQKSRKILLNIPKIIPYRKAIPFLINKDVDNMDHVIPSILPNWDHSPRSGRHAIVLHNSTPKAFDEYLSYLSQVLKNKKGKEQLIFLKSWNEWGEGNYMEPDVKFGKKYIEVLKKHFGDNNASDI